jgi:hypothetical protein
MATDKILVKVARNAEIKVSEAQTIVKKIVTGTPIRSINPAGVSANILDGESAGYYLDFTNLTNVPTILDSGDVLALVESTDIDNLIDSGSGVSILGPVKVSDHIIPDSDETIDLGSPTNKFRSLYLAAGTLYVGNQAIGDSSGILVASKIDASGNIIDGTTRRILTVEPDGTSEGLVFNKTGDSATASQYRDSASTLFTIRDTSITDGKIKVTLASFTPTTSATGQSLNWDQTATQFSVAVDNPSDFTSRFVNSIGSISQVSGDVHETLSDFTTSGPSITPAGGVDWTQTFSTNATGYIRSTSTTITGGSASASVTFLENDGSTNSTRTFTTNWTTPNVSINMSNLSGNIFLAPYTSTSYTVSVTGFSNSNNHTSTVTPSGGTVSNVNGSGTFTFTDVLHQDNTGGRTLAVSTQMSRPVGVTGTAYTVTDTASDTSLSSSWTYPTVSLFTLSTGTAPTNSDVVSGTGFAAGVTQRGNQSRTLSTIITNPESTPQAFFFGVRAAATQPNTFQTGSSSALLSDVTATTVDVTLSNTHTSEAYKFYGITLQPGNTFVSIS